MAYRSDRRGVKPIATLALRARWACRLPPAQPRGSAEAPRRARRWRERARPASGGYGPAPREGRVLAARAPRRGETLALLGASVIKCWWLPRNSLVC